MLYLESIKNQFNKLTDSFEMNHLTLAFMITVLVYIFNTNGYGAYSGWIDTLTEYVLLFIVVALGLAIAYKYLLPPGTAIPIVSNILGTKPVEHGPVGEQIVESFTAPYKFVESQYGDKNLLSGYNESVRPIETGAHGKFEELSKN